MFQRSTEANQRGIDRTVPRQRGAWTRLTRSIPILNWSGSVPWWTTSRCGPERAKANCTMRQWMPERKPVLCPIGMQRVAHRSRMQNVPNGYLRGTLWYAFHKRTLEGSQSEPPWHDTQWSSTVQYQRCQPFHYTFSEDWFENQGGFYQMCRSSQSNNQGGIEICAAIHKKIIQFSGSLPENQGGLASLQYDTVRFKKCLQAVLDQTVELRMTRSPQENANPNISYFEST